jgi:hypothetical protein
MPLGSESALGLAGPNGTPDIDELPAPAEPAGGVNCANALAGATKASAVKRTSARLRDMTSLQEHLCNDHMGPAFPAFMSPAFKSFGFPASALLRSRRRRENQA